MALSIRRGVVGPPLTFVNRFFPQILAVARTAVLLGRVGDVEVTSWYRDPARNANVGGAWGSQHLVGTALDLAAPGVSRSQFLPWVQWAAAQYNVSVPAQPSATSGSSVHIQALPVGTVTSLRRSDPALFGGTAV